MSISCEMLEDVEYLLGLLEGDTIECKNELINSKPFICDVLDAIERLNVENMNNAGIMINLPYDVCENIIIYVGECKYCDYNDEYLFFTEQYKKLEDMRTKAMENIHYETYGPSLADCKEQESPLSEIIQSEQYALWSGQVLFADSTDESAIRINCTLIERYKNVSNAIDKVEIKAMEYISNLTNIPVILLNIVAEFTGSVICDYRSHHNYLSNLVIKNIRMLHIFEQPLNIQTRMYIRHYGIKDYKHTVQTVKLFKRKLAEFIPRLNSTNQIVAYKNRYIQHEKTIANLVIDFLDLKELIHDDIKIIYDLREKIEEHHAYIAENETYRPYYDKSIIEKHNEEINELLMHTVEYDLA